MNRMLSGITTNNTENARTRSKKGGTYRKDVIVTARSILSYFQNCHRCPPLVQNNRGDNSCSRTITTTIFVGLILTTCTLLVTLNEPAQLLLDDSQRSTSTSTTTSLAAVSLSKSLVLNSSSSSSSSSRSISDQQSYQLAYDQSYGYFDDISEMEWNRLRAITKYYRQYTSKDLNEDHHPYKGWYPRTYYQKFWDPEFSCRHEIKMGGGDGGKWMCDPHRLIRISERRMKEEVQQQTEANKKDTGENNADQQRKKGCIVYSIGSNGDFHYEMELADALPNACEIHTFDFTDYSDRIPVKYRDVIHFHPWGLKPKEETPKHDNDNHNHQATRSSAKRTSITSWTLFLTFGQVSSGNSNLPFKTFEETMSELGHTGRPIDVLKIDCEGCEWSTYRDWIKYDVRQLLVETHHAPEIAFDFFKDLQDAGYVIFHKEPNLQFGGGECIEFGMLKLSADYYTDPLQ